MIEREIVIYTDASMDIGLSIAACGYVIFINKEPVDHSVVLLAEITKSSEAEMYAIIFALEAVKDLSLTDRITVYSDCKSIVTQKTFTSAIQRKYQSTKDHFNCRCGQLIIRHVRGHSKSVPNKMVDVSCRKALREKRKELKS